MNSSTTHPREKSCSVWTKIDFITNLFFLRFFISTEIEHIPQYILQKDAAKHWHYAEHIRGQEFKCEKYAEKGEATRNCWHLPLFTSWTSPADPPSCQNPMCFSHAHRIKDKPNKLNWKHAQPSLIAVKNKEVHNNESQNVYKCILKVFFNHQKAEKKVFGEIWEMPFFCLSQLEGCVDHYAWLTAAMRLPGCRSITSGKGTENKQSCTVATCHGKTACC